jgi:hypothetical protein
VRYSTEGLVNRIAAEGENLGRPKNSRPSDEMVAESVAENFKTISKTTLEL